MTTTPDTTSEPTARPAGDIVARADKWYRIKQIIMALVLIGYGIYSIYDGFYRYPRENAAAKAAGKDVLPHGGLDVPFNQVFGIALPPLGLLLGARALYRSRGEIRLSGTTLSAPG